MRFEKSCGFSVFKSKKAIVLISQNWHKEMKNRAVLILILCFWVLNACHKTEFDKIIYSFEDDVSTSQTYHRSYVITITPEKAHIVIRNPDKTLFDANFSLSAGKFEKIKQLTEKLTTEHGLIWVEKCGECKTRQFILHQKEAEVHRIKWNRGELSESGKEALKAVKGTIPRMDDLLKTTLAQD